MAKLRMFSVRDSAVGLFSAPFFLRGRGEAFRAFQDEVSRPESRIFAHPSDYALFEVGSFDEDGAILEALPSPERLALAADLVRKPVEPSDVPYVRH